MSHSLHTVVIDRRGKLVANIEGNRFTSDQLGDVAKKVLNQQMKARAPTSPAY